MRVIEEDCMGCGICVSKCVNEAISLVREPSKGEPLEIEVLMAQGEKSGDT
jgi:translation initiation factor RLI1